MSARVAMVMPPRVEPGACPRLVVMDFSPPQPPARLVRCALAVLITLACAGTLGAVAFAGTDSSDQVPSVEDALLEVERVIAELNASEITLTELVVRRGEIDSRVAELEVQDQLLVERIEVTRAQAREFAVLAFMQGGALGDSEVLLEADGALDFSRRSFFVEDQAARTSESARELDALMASASDELLSLLAESDDVQRRINTEVSRGDALRDELVAAEEGVLISSAWELSDSYVATGRYGEASEAHWDNLRHCESTNNYQAVDPSGVYRGAYQFDRQTWRTVGGTGDPAQAPPLEQDARARALFASRGNQPWPVCGRFLPQVS